MAFFTPKCPVDNDRKEWIEDSFMWFLDHFGEDAFKKSETILPSNKGFPERLFANERTVRTFLEVICGFMDVDYKTVNLKVFTPTGFEKFYPLASPNMMGSSPCGLYYHYAKKHQVAIEQSLLGSPPALVATIAHELAHAKLQSGRAADEKKGTEELLTDLATIFFGMGIFTANSIFGVGHFATAQNQGWRATKDGYIDEATAGYALALFAYMKGEQKPAWTKFLESNPKHYFKQGLKYLVKTGDTKVKVVD
jgi:hypothetical protein